MTRPGTPGAFVLAPSGIADLNGDDGGTITLEQYRRARGLDPSPPPAPHDVPEAER
jgi:hypothetical protein